MVAYRSLKTKENTVGNSQSSLGQGLLLQSFTDKFKQRLTMCQHKLKYLFLFISFVHRNISMRILECPPSDTPGYVDKADQFYTRPSSWILEHFGNASGHKEDISLPTHIVLYNVLLPVSRLSFLLATTHRSAYKIMSD